MGIDPTTKVWKVSRTSAAAVVVTPDTAMLVGSADTAIVCDDQSVTLVGPISLVAQASDIRRGGLFVGLNDFTDMIPSTIVTPIPKQIPLPPINGLMGLSNDVAFFMSLLV